MKRILILVVAILWVILITTDSYAVEHSVGIIETANVQLTKDVIKTTILLNSYSLSVNNTSYLKGKPLQFQGLLEDNTPIVTQSVKVGSKDKEALAIKSLSPKVPKKVSENGTIVTLTSDYNLKKNVVEIKYDFEASPSGRWTKARILLPAFDQKNFPKEKLKFYSNIKGAWEDITSLSAPRFFGQSLAIINSETGKGLAFHFTGSHAYIVLDQDKDIFQLILEHVSSGKKYLNKGGGEIFIVPFEYGTGEKVTSPLIYKGDNPFGVDTYLLYEADDIHSVFSENFVERLKYFEELKSFDPDFKTTFVVVPDIFDNRSKLLDTNLLSSLKNTGYIRFGMHGTYHAYPTDDPSNPEHFDTGLVDFSGPNSNNQEWLDSIIKKGIGILDSQNIPHTVFRAPQYKYTEESLLVLADNNVKLAHVCENSPLFKFSPTVIETPLGNRMVLINDDPCNKGVLTSILDKKSYQSITFSPLLVSLGKETSFHVHIWELWSGQNPYDGNAFYKTYDALTNFLTQLQNNNTYYRWFYGEDVANFYLERDAIILNDIENDVLLDNEKRIQLIVSRPVSEGQNLQVILPNGRYVESVTLNGKHLQFFHRSEGLARIILPSLVAGDYEVQLLLSSMKNPSTVLANNYHVSVPKVKKENSPKPLNFNLKQVSNFMNSQTLIFAMSVTTYLAFLLFGLVTFIKNSRKK
ncbi:MAG: hypothetical protein UU73_C0003G0154 [Candidatus Daviesbacteria bacterium GW2011_GWA1_41_61]|uniref:DUF2334 domain-containing protein n=1 Tax=Candidatus Daviesbacteria bacterium GW2011_GWA2_40_9 TaxID=1618424 RepID=A0A0G0U234_9BACT|nr:MAG: hypothetical protein UU26_C0003G0072 [Candidatus Daviesbacteria bacterium GW2011_GWC1_40_9]KKR83149.1 MAG: hypothetical protein UU29_C0007G0019 [Candidatus Daviesbacteria bacterium GW2011_GWA2_40_9]KKR93496.1 MAG: hypothetical protein UU44_C0002G0157 [Candidatus Daviesbacteria bacterium GW2011_GWB1_41_15]KKS14955.1 MAG: hypothetical protein UU73_C0003G0154 [Candidatus Daviesbacteria bacterium GW2011_GWA1_41_61]